MAIGKSYSKWLCPQVVAFFSSLHLGALDQERFEELLIRWIVTSDQPFNEVENPKLVNLLKYVNWSLLSFKIPSHFTVKCCVVSMGAEGVRQMKELLIIKSVDLVCGK